jgi:hypothetical protein
LIVPHEEKGFTNLFLCGLPTIFLCGVPTTNRLKKARQRDTIMGG